ncbi:hypothetical protein DL767_000032 [Monosporascus sp. MG133]|nr:hypothetical protein DL767_000032 [Monosporascus sp. MG133]
MATYRRLGTLPRYYKASLLRADGGAPPDYNRAAPTFVPSFPTQAPDDGAEEMEAGLLADVESPERKSAFLYDNVPSNNRYTGYDK